MNDNCDATRTLEAISTSKTTRTRNSNDYKEQQSVRAT
jgi:hypothetical protein